MVLAGVRLDDKYALESGRIFLSGIQALVRLPLMQRGRDARAGLNTAAFISGYRGSPLGGFDKALWDAGPLLERSSILFKPGINEDLAATAVWGSQQVELWPGARYDGVFGLWYGKTPGVDRSGDALKHANAAGTSRHGGVLALAGDDHSCKSSSLPGQSEHAFMDAQIPVLNPADIQDILDLGLYGWALSRYSGCWVALKIVSDTADSSASVHVDPERVNILLPEDFPMPPDGLNIRWPDKPLQQEYRLHRHKLYAALAFARANRLDRLVLDSPTPRFGIVTAGKSYLDVRQALDDLGIDAREAARIGIRLYKVAMSWPLEPEGLRRFAKGLEEILVVEEKRGVIENQLKEQLYNVHEAARPRVIGKFDERGEWILPSAGDLTPARIARVIAGRIARFHTSAAIHRRLLFLEQKEQALAASPTLLERLPHFCSGCPHNTSTNVPEGSRAMAGIGCHYMAGWMDRRTETFTHMGAEGVPWIGQAPFTETGHVFANLGDGTYFHSGLLAIRAAVAGGVSMTYKILYNDAVAMTGGQPVDGVLTVPQLTRQLSGESVTRIVVVTDQPDKYTDRRAFAPGVTIHHRRELDALQRELRQVKGVSALVYDQTCAAEKRRRRKKGLLADPPTRAFINTRVCEGCGDCNIKSNCLSVVPVETELGRKRAIDQSQCNKDFTCVDGFCPSFVTLRGGSLRKPEAVAGTVDFPTLPEPVLPDLGEPYGIVITGVGGTGIVTIGALLGMAAHLEGKGVAVLDMTGLAQKYGTVTTHVRIGTRPEAINGPRIPAGEADLLLACDLVVAAGQDVLAKLDPERSAAVVNSHRFMPSGFTRDPDLPFPTDGMLAEIGQAAMPDGAHFLDATALAERLLGDSIMTNLFMVGFAWQRGLVPLSAQAIDRAIELNDVAVEQNRRAFLWGRRAGHDLAAVGQLIAATDKQPEPDLGLEAFIRRRYEDLTAYQDAAYAERYQALVRRVQAVEARRLGGSGALAAAVARSYFKLLAYKDEYEVARLYTDGAFARQLQRTFDGDYRVELHLAPPLLSRPDPLTGAPRKRAFGPWVFRLLGLLARMKGLRGGWFDPFGYGADRKLERKLIGDYEALVAVLLDGLDQANCDYAVQLASLPEQIRGYGHVKANSARHVSERQRVVLQLFHERAGARGESARECGIPA
ncbi:MAG: indolepyruvate ferredoxin oxidoreductase family protein [Aquisalimonadaceae bacterium]